MMILHTLSEKISDTHTRVYWSAMSPEGVAMMTQDDRRLCGECWLETGSPNCSCSPNDESQSPVELPQPGDQLGLLDASNRQPHRNKKP